MMVPQKVDTPVKTGIQSFRNYLKIRDSDIRRNDEISQFLAFCEIINADGASPDGILIVPHSLVAFPNFPDIPAFWLFPDPLPYFCLCAGAKSRTPMMLFTLTFLIAADFRPCKLNYRNILLIFFP
jgi:hypothetical protein